MSNEKWAFVVNHPAFEISTYGNFRRAGSTDLIPQRPDGRLGYYRITTGSASVYGASKLYTHRCVAAAFIEKPDEDSKFIVCHRDGDISNNNVDNLYWGTYSQNTYDSVRHGTHFNAGKDACPRGHDYTGDNLYEYLDKQGRRHRQCLTCKRAAKARYDERLKAKKEIS
jgi:hypothetical protein